MATGGKFLGRFFAILYLVSRFIPWWIEIKRGARWNFRDKKPKLSQCKHPLYPSFPFRWFSFSSFPVTNNVNSGVITSVHAGFLSRHGLNGRAPTRANENLHRARLKRWIELVMSLRYGRSHNSAVFWSSWNFMRLKKNNYRPSLTTRLCSLNNRWNLIPRFSLLVCCGPLKFFLHNFLLGFFFII